MIEMLKPRINHELIETERCAFLLFGIKILMFITCCVRIQKAFIINYLSITSISLSDHHNRIVLGYDNGKNKVNIAKEREKMN